MSPAALLTLQYLIRAEPFITVGALLAWIYAGRRGSGMPTMRDYLAARSVNTTVNISLLYFWIRVHAGPGSWQQEIYLYEYWVGFFVLAWFMLRVAGDVLQRSLRLLPGLQALAKTIFRWVLVSGMLLALPASVAFAIAFVGRTTNELDVLFRFFAAISIAQLFPIAGAAILGVYAGCRPGTRDFGILMAFCLEPAWMLSTNWLRPEGILVWTNLVAEVVCYTALAIWTWSAFHPDRKDQLPPPNPTLQRWDQLARKALRHRLPLIEETEPVAQGARPQPRPND